MSDQNSMRVVRITTGFLGGNLLPEEAGLDTGATITAYARALREAISAAYPEAKVEVRSEIQAQGTTPWALRTHVYYGDGDVQVEDGGLSCHDENVTAVESIAQEVFERGDWYVVAPQ